MVRVIRVRVRVRTRVIWLGLLGLGLGSERVPNTGFWHGTMKIGTWTPLPRESRRRKVGRCRPLRPRWRGRWKQEQTHRYPKKERASSLCTSSLCVRLSRCSALLCHRNSPFFFFSFFPPPPSFRSLCGSRTIYDRPEPPSTPAVRGFPSRHTPTSTSRRPSRKP